MLKLYNPNSKSEQKADFKIFLAGSIEMGKSREWQKDLFAKLNDSEKAINFYNPYKDDWDNTIGNTLADARFHDQVSWEWKKLLEADLVVFNFEKDTKSPISLLELGAMAARGKQIAVCCPEEFWKYGNVQFICDYYKEHSVLMHSFLQLVEGVNKLIEAI